MQSKMRLKLLQADRTTINTNLAATKAQLQADLDLQTPGLQKKIDKLKTQLDAKAEEAVAARARADTLDDDEEQQMAATSKAEMAEQKVDMFTAAITEANTELENLVSATQREIKLVEQKATEELANLDAEEKIALAAVEDDDSKADLPGDAEESDDDDDIIVGEDGKKFRIAADEECRFYSAYTLGKLGANPQNLPLIAEASPIPSLIQLLDSKDHRTRCMAVHALRRLALYAHLRVQMVEDGCLQPLKRIAETDKQIENQRETCACLCNITRSDANRVEVIEIGFVPTLIELMVSGDIETSSQACAAIANLAEHLSSHDVIRKHKGIHFLVYLMRTRHMVIYREATRGVANVLSTLANHDEFLFERGLKGLIQVCVKVYPQLLSHTLAQSLTHPLTH